MKPKYRYSGIAMVISAFLIAQLACEKIEIGDSIYVQVGKEYSVTSNLTFTIDSIREYRCPKDVVCIWAGDVDLFFSILEGSQNKDTIMRLNDHLRNPMFFSGYQWEIFDVLPYPLSDQPTDPKDIRIRMMISRK